jgi:hypothetical protein
MSLNSPNDLRMCFPANPKNASPCLQISQQQIRETPKGLTKLACQSLQWRQTRAECAMGCSLHSGDTEPLVSTLSSPRQQHQGPALGVYCSRSRFRGLLWTVSAIVDRNYCLFLTQTVLLPPEPTGTTKDDGRLVFEYWLTRGFILGIHYTCDGGLLSFI